MKIKELPLDVFDVIEELIDYSDLSTTSFTINLTDNSQWVPFRYNNQPSFGSISSGTWVTADDGGYLIPTNLQDQAIGMFTGSGFISSNATYPLSNPNTFTYQNFVTN